MCTRQLPLHIAASGSATTWQGGLLAVLVAVQQHACRVLVIGTHLCAVNCALVCTCCCPIAGRREWPWAQLWINQNIETSLKAWFGSVEVVRESSEPLDPNERYIFGYTPHGLFPIGEVLSSVQAPSAHEAFGSNHL